MIRVTRTSQPDVLRKNASKWLNTLKKLRANPTSTKDKITKAQNKYHHSQIKDALKKMFHGKCAYCESKITVVDYGAIEHFFPKSLYPDLTFEWKNLLLSCNKCNDAGHKGTKFPLDSNGDPLLIDPTDDTTDPNIHLEFVWDNVAKLASIYGRDERGKTVENIFDLNGIGGRRELIDHRSKYIKKLLVLLSIAQKDDNNSELIALLEEACQPDAEYSAFALFYIYSHLNQLKLSQNKYQNTHTKL